MLVPAWLVPGTPTLGLWCHRCNTSAAVSVPVYLLSACGVQLFRRQRLCTRCDA